MLFCDKEEVKEIRIEVAVDGTFHVCKGGGNDGMCVKLRELVVAGISCPDASRNDKSAVARTPAPTIRSTNE